MASFVSEKSSELQAFIDFIFLPSTRIVLVLSMIILAIILALFLKNKKPIVECNKYYFIVWLCFVISEVSKQIYMKAVLGYDWWACLPVQFSALPLYTFILMPLCKTEFSRNVIKVLTGPYCFFIGLLFWTSPWALEESMSYYAVIQGVSWHLELVFFGMFNTLVYKIYTMKFFKPFIAALCSMALFMIFGLACNVVFSEVQLQFFYCAPHLSVYPLINLFWHSTTPFLPYACVFVLTVSTVSVACFFVLVGFGKLFSIIYKKVSKMCHKF